jgi:hypothetical protein
MAVAVAVKPVPSVAVAVTLQAFAELGAVNTPELVIDPHEADQVTGWLAVKVCVFKACRFTVEGVTVTEVLTVTVVLAVRALPSVAVATTVHEFWVDGAVYIPPLAMEPQVVVQVDATLEANGTTPVTETVGFRGEMVITALPTPDSATVCGLLVAESVKLRVAVRVPSAVGLNTTVAEQFAVAARLAPQVVEMAKSEAFAPLMAMLPMLTAVVRPLPNITDCEALLDPTTVPAKVRLAGLAATMAGALPRPVRAIVCGLPLSESLKFSSDVRVPVAVGPNTIFAVQLAPAASVVPQVLLKTEKSPGLAPLNVMPLRVIGVVLPLVRVATFCPPLLPMATAAQEMVAGETEALPVVPVPVPESATVCGLFVAVLVKLRVAVRVPAALGLKATETEHTAEAARLAVQVEAEIVKSAALTPVMAMLLSAMDAGPFDSVTDCDALPDPTDVLANERLVGKTVALEAANPVPVRVTAWGLLVAESVKVRVAVRVPAAVGLNTTLAEQLAAAARLAPQVAPEIVKSEALAPVMAIPLMVTAVVRPLASVADCDALLDPTTVPAKERLAGLTVTLLAAVPRPVRAMVCGLLPSESLKLSVAVRVPVAVGPNRMFAVQLAPAASVEPHVLLKTEKSPGLAPLKVILPRVIAVAFPLVRVATFCPPLLPMATAAHEMLAGETDTCAKQNVPGRTQERIATRPNLRRDGTRRLGNDSAVRTPDRPFRTGAATPRNTDKMYILPPRRSSKREDQPTIELQVNNAESFVWFSKENRLLMETARSTVALLRLSRMFAGVFARDQLETAR